MRLSALSQRIFSSPLSPLRSQTLGKIFAQTPTATPISTLPSTLQPEKSGPPIKVKSSAYLRPDFYFVTLQISLLFFHSLRPSITTRPSPLLPPSSSDSQQEPALSSKLVRKPSELNHPWISLWAIFDSHLEETSERP